MKNMWKIYEELIDGIPEDITVTDYCSGSAWSYVENSLGQIGTAMTVNGRNRSDMNPENLMGKKLKDVATLVKSWDFIDATLGMAAINSWYNSPDKIEQLNGFADLNLKDGSWEERTKKEAFVISQEEIRGKKVACIGHFPYLEKQIGNICDLSILERDPSFMDYPDMACEYILKEQSYVFMTGVTFTNKTLPRLLQICEGGPKVILVGPSAPCAPLLSKYGVEAVMGFTVTDPDIFKERIKRGGQRDLFKGGRMIDIKL